MKYDPALDGLRGVAVAVVVIYHAWNEVLPGGAAGVDVFFVLSGFLITNILSRELITRGTIDLKRFYLRRSLRLMPAFVIVLLAVLALVPFQNRPASVSLREIAASASYMMNWYRAFTWGPDDALGHTWSLATEEQFYLVWPIFLLLSRPTVRVRLTLLLVVIITAWRCWLVYAGAPVNRTLNGFDTHSDAILIGCLLAFRRGERPLPIEGASALSAFAAATLILLFSVARYDSPFAASIGLTLAAVASAVIIVCARSEGWLRSTLTNSVLVFTGRISYGLYLWHYPLIVIAMRHLPHRFMWLPVLLAYFMATVSFYVVEVPARRLRQWFAVT